MKVALLVGGGPIQVKQAEVALELGYYIVVTDSDDGCEVVRRGLTNEFRSISTYDVPAHIRLAQELQHRCGKQFAGVFTSGADVEHTVAFAAAFVGLPGVDPRAAYATHHKPRMREIFDRCGIPNPAWAEVANLAQAHDAIKRIRYPLIVKNTDNCASRGTTILREHSFPALDKAVQDAVAVSRSRTALIEELFTGPEQTVETLMHDGQQYRCFITDRMFLEPDKWAVESGLQSPTALDTGQQEALYEMVGRAAFALGIDFGAAKADTIWTPNGPRIIEMTCRLSGGYDCQVLVPAASGKEIVRAAFLQAMGESFNPDLLRPRWDRCAVSLNPLPEPGRVVRISGLEEALQLPGIHDIYVRVKAGDRIRPYTDCAARPVWIFATGWNHGEAWQNARQAADTLIIDTVSEVDDE